MEGCRIPIRIAFVCNVDWFFISHRLPLAKEALAKGFKVYLLCRDTGRKKELEALGIEFIDIPFIRSGKNPIHEIRCIGLLYKSYKRIRPNIIHHITLKGALLGSVAAKIAGKRDVVNAISGFGYNFTDGRNGLLQKIIKILMRLIFKSKYFHFILQNPDDVNIIKSLGFVPEEHIHLIKGSGIDLEEYSFSPATFNDKLKFLFPARLLYDKGLMELINAAKKLKKRIQGKVVFILAGDCDHGNLASISEKELKKNLIPDYIEWVGFQKNMYELYQKANVVVLPSYREGLPKSLIEACAVGRPIITTNAPGCKECVKNGENGYLIPIKNTEALAKAIVLMLEGKEKLIVMGRKSRDLAEEEFSLNTVVNKTFNIYNLILNG